MNNTARYTVPILILSLVLAAGTLTCKKDSPDAKKASGVTADNDLSSIIPRYKTENINTRTIVTRNYIGTPFDDTVAKLIKTGDEGAYKKYSLTIYASPMNRSGRVPDKAYVWTSVLAGTKDGNSSRFFVIDSAKTLRGERYGYAYITGDILIGDMTDIVVITEYDGKVTAVDYYNPNGSRTGRKSAYRNAL
ncbi:MAG: hypothetical protein ACRCUT_15155 [Spirochaetota bacterium]